MELPLIFQCGTEVHIDAVYCRKAYSGLTIGRPDEKINELVVQTMLKEARKMLQCEGKPYLFSPKCTIDGNGNPNLPHYACALELTSYRPVHDMGKDCSGAVIVWFQDNFEVFSSRELYGLTKSITWKEVAFDGNW